MTDPVAEAAANLAKQQAEPSLLDKAMDTIHDLEAKVEHLIHPETPPNVEPVAPLEASAAPVDTAVAPVEALSSLEVPAPAVAPSGEAPNVLPASTSGTLPESTPSAPLELPLPTGSPSTEAEVPNAAPAAVDITGENSPSAPAASTSVTAAGEIRAHIASIKHHLSIRGFEQSAVADIHAELEAIERWL
jgi:hypothetical protein